MNRDEPKNSSTKNLSLRKPSGLVLAGGQSSRMGQDKATLILDGQTLAERARQNLQPWCDQVFISLRDSQDRANLEGPFLFDQVQDCGPLAAFLAAHDLDSEQDWFVLPCDLPGVTAAALEALALALGSRAWVIGFAQEDGHPQPLFGMWSAPALKALKRNFLAGTRSPLKTALQVPHLFLKPEKSEWLMNINERQDWDRWRLSASAKLGY